MLLVNNSHIIGYTCFKLFAIRSMYNSIKAKRSKPMMPNLPKNHNCRGSKISRVGPISLSLHRCLSVNSLTSVKNQIGIQCWMQGTKLNFIRHFSLNFNQKKMRIQNMTFWLQNNESAKFSVFDWVRLLVNSHWQSFRNTSMNEWMNEWSMKRHVS